MHKNLIRGSLILAASVQALMYAPPALSQDQTIPSQLGGGVSFENYTFADPDQVGIEKLSLMTAPFGARVAIGRRLALEAAGAFATGTLTRSDGTESEISHLTDTELRAIVPLTLGRAIVTLTAVGILPTGFDEYTLEEAEVAGAIAADLLPFRLTNWGSGGGFAGAVSIAQPFGASSVGVSAGYRVTREFEPVSGFLYRPGNEMRVRFAADHTFGRSRKAALHVTLFGYDDDQFAGQNALDTGDRLQVVGSYAFPAPSGSSAVLYAGMLHRSEGNAFELDEDVTGIVEPAAQTLLIAGTGARVSAGSAVLLPTVDMRMFRREDGVGQGFVVGIGSSAEVPLGRSGISLIPTARYRIGNLQQSEGLESGINGFEAAITARLGGL